MTTPDDGANIKLFTGVIYIVFALVNSVTFDSILLLRSTVPDVILVVDIVCKSSPIGIYNVASVAAYVAIRFSAYPKETLSVPITPYPRSFNI